MENMESRRRGVTSWVGSGLGDERVGELEFDESLPSQPLLRKGSIGILLVTKIADPNFLQDLDQ
jgi:hypothetical protein